MTSKLKVDQLEGNSGSTITVPTGQTLTITDGMNVSNLTGTLPVTKGGTGLSSLGSAGQALKVNTAGNALEFGSAGGLVSTGFNDSTTSHTIQASSFTEINGSAFNVAMTSGQKIHLYAKIHGYQDTADKTEHLSMFVTESGASEVNILNTATNSGGMGLSRASYSRYWNIGATDKGLPSFEGWFTWNAQTTGTHSFTIKVYSASGSLSTQGTTVWYMITSV